MVSCITVYLCISVIISVTIIQKRRNLDSKSDKGGDWHNTFFSAFASILGKSRAILESQGFAIVLGTGRVDSTVGYWGHFLISFSDPRSSWGRGLWGVVGEWPIVCSAEEGTPAPMILPVNALLPKTLSWACPLLLWSYFTLICLIVGLTPINSAPFKIPSSFMLSSEAVPPLLIVKLRCVTDRGC